MLVEDMVMGNYSKQQIQEQARNGIINVRFTKVNGEERVMNCTLLSEYLPKQMDFSESKPNDQVLSVWDVDIGGWRSFRVESVSDVGPQMLTEDMIGPQ